MVNKILIGLAIIGALLMTTSFVSLAKFDIDSDLIPEKGRLVQCSKCNNKWFFTKDKEIDKTTKETKEFIIAEDIESVVEKNNE